jgi:hypothetical protein
VTVLDDTRLASLLGAAGAAIEVPATGPDDILARARGALGDGTVDVTADPEPDGAHLERPSDDAVVDNDAAPIVASPRPVRRVVVVARRHRVLSVAACVVVLLVAAGAIGVIISGRSAPPRLASTLAPHTHTTPPTGSVTPTTAPPFATKGTSGSVSAGASQNGAALPYSANAQHALSTPAVTTPTSPGLPQGAVGQSAKIEQTGTLGLTVGRGDLGRTMTQLTGLAGANGGFVANSQAQSGAESGGPPYGTVTLQVPVDNFSTVLTQAQKLGKTSSLTTKATDVTGQYVDLQSRITALEASRQQYLTIMAKATTVGDVLAVQEQIDTIQGQIEQLQGQLQVLTSETSYSTLTVNVSEGAPAPRPSPLPESGMIRAWHDSVGGFVAGVEDVVRVAGPLLFVLLCLAIAVVGGRALWRRYQRHRL